MPPSVADGPVSRSGRPRRWLRLVLGNLAVLAALLLICEGVARGIVWFWEVPTEFRARPFQQFGQTDPVAWWRVRSNLDTTMLGVRLRTNRRGFRDPRDELPGGAVRVFCLGDSTTFGWKVEADAMYTAVAERAVREATGRDVAIVSAGVPGYTSYQCLQQFRETIAPLRPDWIVVMASNNECRARNLGDRERGAGLARKRALQRWLGWSRVWLLLSRAPEALARGWDLDPKPGRVANTAPEYRQNLRELIRAARAEGSRVLVLNMPLRLRLEPDWPHFDELSPRVADLIRRSDEQTAPSARRSLLDDALALQPDQFAAHWKLAQVELSQGHPAEADRQFAQARNDDLHPDAAKPLYNRALEELAAEESVPFLDIDRLFRESGHADDALFLDHCHPTALGQRLIGEALAARLASLLAGG